MRSEFARLKFLIMRKRLQTTRKRFGRRESICLAENKTLAIKSRLSNRP